MWFSNRINWIISNVQGKNFFLIILLASDKVLAMLGSWIGTCSVFFHSYSVSPGMWHINHKYWKSCWIKERRNGAGGHQLTIFQPGLGWLNYAHKSTTALSSDFWTLWRPWTCTCVNYILGIHPSEKQVKIIGMDGTQPFLLSCSALGEV